MKRELCEEFAPLLVELADGELPEAQVQVVHEHLKTCSHCRKMSDALNRSLGLTRAIWTDAESKSATTAPVLGRGARRWARAGAGLAAAGVLLAIGIQATWRHMRPRQIQTQVTQTELTPERMETIAARAGVSAQMLAAAEYLAENGGAELARERLIYLADAYPETDAAAVARSRLKSERITQ